MATQKTRIPSANSVRRVLSNAEFKGSVLRGAKGMPKIKLSGFKVRQSKNFGSRVTVFWSYGDEFPANEDEERRYWLSEYKDVLRAHGYTVEWSAGGYSLTVTSGVKNEEEK